MWTYDFKLLKYFSSYSLNVQVISFVVILMFLKVKSTVDLHKVSS